MENELLQQILDNQKLMLVEIKDLKTDVNDLKTDVNDLKRGQAALEKGQTALEKGQTSLEKGQTSLEKGQIGIIHRLDKMEQDITEIKDDVKYLKFASDEAFKDIGILDRRIDKVR